jgi:hypothetical protein
LVEPKRAACAKGFILEKFLPLMHRKQFLSLALAGVAAPSLFAAPGLWSAPAEPDPALPADLVQEFVGKAHRDLDRVRVLLDQQPKLLYATWDWGAGDFETAVGAAAHVGFVDMAKFLLEKGARADLFVLTMLGHTAIVKAMLEAFPAMLHSYGAHGYTLLHHARRGEATELAEYLESKGLTETYVNIFNKKK